MAPQLLLGELAGGGDGARRLDLEEEPPRPGILLLVQEVNVRESERERESSIFVFVAFSSGCRSSILLSSCRGTARSSPHCWC
jgi:hypothetical protein